MPKISGKMLDPQSSPKARGKRFRVLRMMTSLSRKEVYQEFGLSSSTQQSWEDAKAGGLTEKGAKRAIKVFRNAGIRCSLNWLLYGIGEPPQLISYGINNGNMKISEKEESIAWEEDKAIIRELLIFRECNQNAVDVVINDDGMAPQYQFGDYVGGIRYYNEAIRNLIGQNCIVETINHDILLRRVRIGNKPGAYTLMCTNFDTTVKDIVLYDQILLCAAPVIWHRRRKKELLQSQ